MVIIGGDILNNCFLMRRKGMGIFWNRVMRAAKLEVNLYEEVEADQGALTQAIAVVVLSSVAAGVGTIGVVGISGIIMGTVMSLIGWCIWAFLIYLIGTKLLPEPQTKADYGELLRTIGFASSPGLLRILGIIPGLMLITQSVASIWMLVATVIAVRQALDYSGTLRAVGVCAIGWIIQIAISMVLFRV